MKRAITILFLILAQFCFAQVGINTNTPETTLDIKASSETSPGNDDGVLIPRVDNLPASAMDEGQLLYKNGTGLMYWTGSVWEIVDASRELLSLTATAANTLSTTNAAREGFQYYTTDTKVLYIGLNDGTLQVISDFTPQQISNELYFDDVDYYYVSMQVGSSDYLVIRYSKTNLNVEEESAGTGTQPSNLTSVQGLTYL